MAGEGDKPLLAALLGELTQRGGITITTPPQRELEEDAEIDLVTVLQLDGVVVMHVSSRLLADPARRDRRVAEHLAQVALTLGPLADLRRLGQAVERVFSAALVMVPQVGWIFHTWQVVRAHGELTSLRSFMLFSVGAVGGPVGYWVRGYAARLFGWGVGLWARRALPRFLTREIFTARRG